jgi:hypothetical protein
MNYKFLKDDASLIRTGKFFQFMPAAKAFPGTIEHRPGAVPKAYAEFVQRFANAELFRKEEHGWYVLEVSGDPEIEMMDSGKKLLKFGTYMPSPHTSTYAFFKQRADTGEFLPEVFEGYAWSLRRVADDFDAWFTDRYRRIRKQYDEAQWRWVLQGPEPFDQRERSIVKAMALFRWSVKAILPGALVEFEVFNGSRRTLPALTVGWRVGRTESRSSLRVAEIKSGAKATVRHDFSCLGKSLTPDKMEFFRPPSPEPEDRCLYWEFGDKNLRRLKPRMPAKKLDLRPARASNPYRRFGPGKELWDITLEDLRAHPVWLSAEFLPLDDDEIERCGSEAWMRPALRETNVSSDMYRPLILLRNDELRLWFSGICNLAESKVESIAVLRGRDALPLDELDGVPLPLALSAVPRIDGAENVRFLCDDLDASEATLENPASSV